MSENNWSKWGEDIKQTVQHSIDSQNFSNLNENVGRIVDSAIKNVNDSLKTANKAVNDGLKNANKTVNMSFQQMKWSGNNDWRYTNTKVRKNVRNKRSQYPAAKKEKQMIPKLFGETGVTTGLGVVLTCVGFFGAATTFGAMALTFVVMLLGSGVHRVGGIASLIMLGTLFGASIFSAVKGMGMIGRVNRFHRYVKELGNKMYCSIQELAKRTGKSVGYVQKDLKYMIQKGFFRQGHLDEQGTCLMISNEAYDQYQETRKQYLLREQEKQEKDRENAALPENVRQVIADGEAFVKKIHASNDAIPGEEISAKIARMEDIVQKILQRIKEKPELVSDVKKLMGYYLPTTVKLLDAYEKLDAQPIQGPNIVSSKQEIEKTMDTLNSAFEKILDDFYQDTAWDISSDISVLNTVLAQEGLKDSDFKIKA